MRTMPPRYTDTSKLSMLRQQLLAVLMCFLIAGCEAFSWGSDSSGQLGDGTIGGSRNAPGVSAAGFKWLVLTAGWNHTCGVRDDSTLWCWGDNNFGQLGLGYEDIDSAVPLQVGTASDWEQVSASSQHTCGIRAGGQLWCWGRGTSGQLGDGLSTTSFVPVRVGTQSDWQEVSVGGFRFTCGIRGQGVLYCWGNNTNGQLGLGDYASRSTPTLLASSPWKGVNAGTRHACAIAATDLGYCWGDNTNEQISSDSDANYTTPVLVLGRTVSQVAAANNHSCFLYSTSNAWDGIIRCIGDDLGLLGSSKTDAVGCLNNPCEIFTTTPRFRFFDMGPDAACGIERGTNVLLCWGEGSNGTMGDGFNNSNLLPDDVLGARSWWSVSVGSNHVVALENP